LLQPVFTGEDRARSILVVGVAKRLGYNPLLLSAVGGDSLGDAARQEIAALGLDGFLFADHGPIPNRHRTR